MNVFVDFHHASLLNSFILLFEDRLGGNVYRPIGTEWYKNGYWKVYDHPATVEQFLGIGGATPDGTQKLNELEAWYGTGIGRSLPGDGIVSRATDATVYECHDIDSGKTNKAITLDGFFHLPIDIVIASLPEHLEPFKMLCNNHFNHPKLIYQVGNAWPVGQEVMKYTVNVMSSTRLHNRFMALNYVEYHQEFDTTIFSPNESNMADKTIASFVNCFSNDRLFADDWALFQIVESMMPDWEFLSFGGQCRNGACHGSKELATCMKTSRFIWHTKRGGDGYGHVLHNSAAIGRPIIFKKEYYEGKLGEQLMIDGATGIQIDNLSADQIKNKIEYYNEESRYAKLCENVYNNFKKVVGFDEEFLKLDYFLKNLV